MSDEPDSGGRVIGGAIAGTGGDGSGGIASTGPPPGDMGAPENTIILPINVLVVGRGGPGVT